MNRHIKSFWLLPLAGMTLSFMPSCTTDSYGNSSVTPGGAAAIGVGALAAGAAIGAAVQHDRDKDRYRNDWRHHNPPPPPPRPPHRPQWRRYLLKSQTRRMPRSAQVMRCLALSGSLRIEPSKSRTGRAALESCTWSCPERIKGGSPAADKVNEDVHGVSHEHGSFLLGFPYGFQQHKGMARMDS